MLFFPDGFYWRDSLRDETNYAGPNLVPQVFVPYYAGLTKRATPRKFHCRVDFDCFWKQSNWPKVKYREARWSCILKARHAQFNRKPDIFGLQIGSFQRRSFPNRWSRGTKSQDTRVPSPLQSKRPWSWFECESSRFASLQNFSEWISSFGRVPIRERSRKFLSGLNGSKNSGKSF